MKSLQVAELCVDRGERRVLDRVSFTVAAGRACAVTGPNGVGKSTLLRAIAGLTGIESGTVTFLNWDSERAGAIHFVGHLDAVKPQFSVAENAAFWCRWLGDGSAGESVVEAALDTVGLLHLAEMPAQFLSQGQRRRLALARLRMAPRPLWLLDEPTAGLDTASRATFAAMMANHLAGGGLVLAATHEPLGIDGADELRLAPS
ncbi:heme ABC exporter ATP-binding protein CcmA [Acuticoccus sp. M5D2P5]|uniref:heme ABC exporter ATP-binding protein CcmA n=1 Tax=Acuticoccus kalidii TaxID=2910977 RepID=UPI001F398D95|nr:heme ABC exporter ATP-binding protein CcmA [Acuticoccus kalidii]MCF3936039.1 heme ABC exporter ATP-binding protein CcmA [Acuticoccus kalidii]